MSKVFEVTATDGTKVTINADHVVCTTDTNPVEILLSTGDSVKTSDSTYRSVRGYVKKGLDASAAE